MRSPYTTSSWLRCRWERESRYYEITLEQDLWGQWIITRCWGSKLTRQSQTRVEYFSSAIESMFRYHDLRAVRLQRYYTEQKNKKYPVVQTD